MLTAIASNKAGRVRFDGSELNFSWREVFRRSEDLLTAAFFSRLRYLSDASLARVLGLLIGQEAADRLGALDEIEFWPHLVGLEQRSWVEPDVLLHFENATLIVEVKPPFGGDQCLAQWQAEIQAFVAACRTGSRTLPPTIHFLALGRNKRGMNVQVDDEFDTRGCFELNLHTREWEPLVLAMSNLAEGSGRSDRAIIEDWQKAFELFGLHVSVQHSWAGLVGMTTSSLLSVTPLTAWPVLPLSEVDGTSPNMANGFNSSWQALLGFALIHPLVIPLWK
jgi:hypothetical protein